MDLYECVQFKVKVQIQNQNQVKFQNIQTNFKYKSINGEIKFEIQD